MELNSANPNPQGRRGTATLGAPTLRIVTYPADMAPRSPIGYREIVAGLASDVVQLAPAALSGLPASLPALRAAVVDAVWLVSETDTVLFGALSALSRTLDAATDGPMPSPAQLGTEMTTVVRTVMAAPPPRSIAVNYALKHLVGVIGAVSGKLLAANREATPHLSVVPDLPRQPVAAPAPVAFAPVVAAPVVSAPMAPTPMAPAFVGVVPAESAGANRAAEEASLLRAEQRFADALIGGAIFFGGFLCGGMMLIGVPEAAIAVAGTTILGVTTWSVLRGL